MKVYHGSYLVFCVSGQKFKVKEIIHNIEIWIIAIFVFDCFVAVEIVVSIDVFCSCKGKY